MARYTAYNEYKFTGLSKFKKINLNEANTLFLTVKDPTHSSLKNVLQTEWCDLILLLLQMVTAFYQLPGFSTQFVNTVHSGNENCL